VTDPGGEIDMERVICALHELDDPGTRGFTLGGGNWPLQGFVVRRGAVVRAYLNRCPHAGHPLNFRPHEFLAPSVSSPLILCRSHGAAFEIETGHCVIGPCAGRALRGLPIRLEGDYVLLDEQVPLEEPE
jgi:nitrite reductase/ring-hydroxylating ferredoxin subunit